MRRDGFLDAVGDYVKPAGALASSVVAIAAFAANGCPDTSGDGNNFRLEGRVETVGDRSLTLEVGRILVARGRAQDTFHADKTIQVHDNYQHCISSFKATKTVGHERASDGSTESLDDVHVGELVELDGKIRSSASVCSRKVQWYGHRAVFDQLTEIG